jgi:uncharacterized cupin superfamily protein
MKLVRGTEIAAMQERGHQHQFNANAIRLTRTLGILAELTDIGIHLIRLRPGNDSTQFHHHDSDEEFIYVLEGTASASIGDSQFQVSAGDFMGFPTPSPGHSLHNDSECDLRYLVGGERNPADVVHYPRIRRSMIKSFGRRSWVDWSDLHDLP